MWKRRRMASSISWKSGPVAIAMLPALKYASGAIVQNGSRKCSSAPEA